MPHRVELPDWALKRARSMNVFSSVEPAKTAVVVVDLQNGFLDAGTPAAVEFGLPILPRVNRVIAAARQAGSTIVFLRQTFSDEPGRDLAPWQKDVSPGIARLRSVLRLGQLEHEVHSGLDRRDEDLVVDKYRHSAFNRHGSDLDERLRSLGVDTLVITGAMTNVCCESTARDAYALGYRVFFLSDATAALTDDEHNAALLNVSLCFADVRDTASMVALFEEASSPE